MLESRCLTENLIDDEGDTAGKALAVDPAAHFGSR